MAKQSIRVGVISHVHTWALTMLPDVRSVDARDIHAARTHSFQERYGAEAAFTAAIDQLGRDEIDVIVNVTANNLHAPLTVAAAVGVRFAGRPAAATVPSAG